MRHAAAAIQRAGATGDALTRLQGPLAQLFAIVEQSDAAPASQVLAVANETLDIFYPLSRES